jgi:methyltransferase-like protein/cyclopropane fatty-acyl-phospholipid synthase-like methyltransferase
MSTAGTSTNLYDEVLYPEAVHVHTHPDRLATVAVLRGMRPTPVDHCRVIEFGCGVGSNLIAMSFNFPQSTFLGIDLANGPVAAGQESIAELGLKNISLHQLDLCEANQERFGSFDYIIAHGLYSWVPQVVRERILTACLEMLTPQGIAYISYNAYPGNHLRDLARGIIRFHTAHFKRPAEKIQQARGILKFLAESTSTPDAYITALQSESERAVKYRDEAFFHDDLSEINQSFYFHEFIRDAERHGLQFLGEASPNEVDPEKVTAEVLSKLNELQGSSEIVREQYKDFVRGCGFRRTLLCHQDVQLSPRPMPERVTELYVSCDASPIQSDGGPASDTTVFRRPEGTEIETAHPLVVAALKHICSEWPCTIPFAAVLDRATSSVSGNARTTSFAGDTAALAEALLRAYESDFLQLHVVPRPVVNKASERPVSSTLARFQVKRGELATSQLHKFVRLEDPLSRQLVQLLDGTRNHEAIIDALLVSIRSGRVELCENGAVLTDPDRISDAVERRLPEVLRALTREGFLVG